MFFCNPELQKGLFELLPLLYRREFVLPLVSQVTFIYIALFTIQIESKQLHIDNMKIIQQSLFPEENCVKDQSYK